MYCHEPAVVIHGPVRTGKSLAALETLNIRCIKYPGTRGIIARKTRKSLSESILVTLEDEVYRTGTTLARLKDGPQRSHRSHYEYPNKSRIVLGGLDDPQSWMSAEFDWIYIPEATEIREREFEMLTTRLTRTTMGYQQVMLDCNPGPPSHWIYQRMLDGRLHAIPSRLDENPKFHDGTDWTPFGRQYIANVLEKLTGVRRARLKDGKWVSAEGQVYDQWDPTVHVVPRFPIPKSWYKFVTVDFGLRNPFVMQWWALDHDRRMYMYREIYMTGVLTEDHAKVARAISLGEDIEIAVCDHDAEDRLTLQRHWPGLITVPARKDIKTGIEAMQDRIRPQQDGRPRIFILENSLIHAPDPYLKSEKHWPYRTEDEFESYVWTPDQEGKPQKEKPIPEFDHGLDAARYGVMYVDRGMIEVEAS